MNRQTMQTLLLMMMAMTMGCRAGNLIGELEKSGATTLLGFLKSAGLDAALVSGYYIVFAPTNRAFAALPQNLQDLVSNNHTVRDHILTFHAVAAIFRATDAFNNLQLVTVNGQKMRINVYSDGDATPVVTAEGGRVVSPDIVATNGYIHLVDRVLMPPSGDLYHLVATSEELSTFKSLIDAAGLRSQLTDHEETLLAPTNEAFKGLVAALGQSTFDAIVADTVVLKEILLYHMTESVVFGAGAFNGSYVTRDMYTSLDVSTGTDDVTYINHARVIMGDVPATNGVMHVLDKVLMPPKYIMGVIG